MGNGIYSYAGKDCISVNLDLTDVKLRTIGERIIEATDVYYEEDFLHISIWQAFLNSYLRLNAPEIYEVLKVIPASECSEMYCAYIEGVNEETKALADKFVQIIDDLVNDEEKIFAFIEQNADDIDWDRSATVRYAEIEAVAPYSICDYVLYGLYLGDSKKFSVRMSGDFPTGPRRTGDDSGYCIELKYNNKQIEDPIWFFLTSTGPETVYVQGGVGTTHVDSDMDANSAIQLLLSY